MPANSATFSSAPSDLAWRVIGLLNLYRLLVPVLLLMVQILPNPQWALAPSHPSLFLSACIAYFTAAALLVIARRFEWSSLRIVTLLNASVDAAALSLILYAAGGVSSGLGILLVIPVASMAVLSDHRDAFLLAAVAAIGVLVQQSFVSWQDGAPSTDYTTAGVLGAVLFFTALSVWPIANRLRESEALVRRRELDLANLAQLSQYIVQHLRESLLVVDTQDRIRLINESAAQILGDASAYPDALLGEASPRLLYLLERWRQNEANLRVFPQPEQTFVAADGARIIRAHFAPLGSASPAPVLIFLEDTSLLADKVQQSKLAALGRLSASIAHEIRNPVGAMSHAAQLLGEAAHLSEEERRMTEIMRSNAERVSTIINNVLRLSKREEIHLETLSLPSWTEEFQEEFCETMQMARERLRVPPANYDVEVRVDPSHLHQIVWNLCENALRHGCEAGTGGEVELSYGRLSPTFRPFLQVMDRGPGVKAEFAERIFEPFFSSGRGTGLGLFLARELAQTNGATLLYEPRQGGGSIFRLVFSDPRRWEAGLT
jgi:two-component system, NtrC family, sensor histidine kinase PilS